MQKNLKRSEERDDYMMINYSTELVNSDLISLYCLIGEAICMIQHLEGALSVSITLKKDVRYPGRIPREEADSFLKKYRSLTLGKAVKIVEENQCHAEGREFKSRQPRHKLRFEA